MKSWFCDDSNENVIGIDWEQIGEQVIIVHTVVIDTGCVQLNVIFESI